MTAWATSSAVPKRFSGTWAISFSRTSSRTLRSMSVSVKPGATAFTVMLSRASSRAAVFVQEIRPPFAAA